MNNKDQFSEKCPTKYKGIKQKSSREDKGETQKKKKSNVQECDLMV